MPETVELHSAFMWDCPDCGRENFTRAMTLELPPEDLAEIKDEEGFPAEVDGVFLAAPDKVTCQFCRRAFLTQEDA
jgi:hypothetical protein